MHCILRLEQCNYNGDIHNQPFGKVCESVFMYTFHCSEPSGGKLTKDYYKNYIYIQFSLFQLLILHLYLLFSLLYTLTWTSRTCLGSVISEVLGMISFTSGVAYLLVARQTRDDMKLQQNHTWTESQSTQLPYD